MPRRVTDGHQVGALLTRTRPEFGSRWPLQLGGVKGLEGVEDVGALGVHVPFEEAQHDRIAREVGDREAVLLDRFHVLVNGEVTGRRGAHLPNA